MATNPTPLPRSLPGLFQDYLTTGQRLACTKADYAAAPTTDREDRWTDLEHRHLALFAEMEVAFFERTGVNMRTFLAAVEA